MSKLIARIFVFILIAAVTIDANQAPELALRSGSARKSILSFPLFDSQALVNAGLPYSDTLVPEVLAEINREATRAAVLGQNRMSIRNLRLFIKGDTQAFKSTVTSQYALATIRSKQRKLQPTRKTAHTQYFVEFRSAKLKIPRFRLPIPREVIDKFNLRKGIKVLVRNYVDPVHGDEVQIFDEGAFDFINPENSNTPISEYFLINGILIGETATMLDIYKAGSGERNLQPIENREVSAMAVHWKEGWAIHFSLNVNKKKIYNLTFSFTDAEAKELDLEHKPVIIRMARDPRFGSFDLLEQETAPGKPRKLIANTYFYEGRGAAKGGMNGRVDFDRLALYDYLMNNPDIENKPMEPPEEFRIKLYGKGILRLNPRGTGASESRLPELSERDIVLRRLADDRNTWRFNVYDADTYTAETPGEVLCTLMRDLENHRLIYLTPPAIPAPPRIEPLPEAIVLAPEVPEIKTRRITLNMEKKYRWGPLGALSKYPDRYAKFLKKHGMINYLHDLVEQKEGFYFHSHDRVLDFFIEHLFLAPILHSASVEIAVISTYPAVVRAVWDYKFKGFPEAEHIAEKIHLTEVSQSQPMLSAGIKVPINPFGGNSVKFRYAKNWNIPLEPASRDIVFMSFEKDQRPDLNSYIAMLREAYDVVRPGGLLIPIERSGSFNITQSAHLSGNTIPVTLAGTNGAIDVLTIIKSQDPHQFNGIIPFINEKLPSKKRKRGQYIPNYDTPAKDHSKGMSPIAVKTSALNPPAPWERILIDLWQRYQTPRHIFGDILPSLVALLIDLDPLSMQTLREGMLLFIKTGRPGGLPGREDEIKKINALIQSNAILRTFGFSAIREVPEFWLAALYLATHVPTFGLKYPAPYEATDLSAKSA